MKKWERRYLRLAREVSLWSKDPSSKIGAVAVSKTGQILALGYNGFPRGIDDSDERLNDKETKYKLVVHAELNCIYNAVVNGVSVKDSTLYIYGLPVCNECAKGIIQTGIKEVIIIHPDLLLQKWEESFKTSKTMFLEAGVDVIVYSIDEL